MIFSKAIYILILLLVFSNIASASSNRTYISNYNTTLNCISTTTDNETTQLCTGQIAVVPYNQDYLFVFELLQTICAILITFYFLFMFAMAKRG